MEKKKKTKFVTLVLRLPSYVEGQCVIEAYVGNRTDCHTETLLSYEPGLRQLGIQTNSGWSQGAFLATVKQMDVLIAAAVPSILCASKFIRKGRIEHSMGNGVFSLLHQINGFTDRCSYESLFLSVSIHLWKSFSKERLHKDSSIPDQIKSSPADFNRL